MKQSVIPAKLRRSAGSAPPLPVEPPAGPDIADPVERFCREAEQAQARVRLRPDPLEALREAAVSAGTDTIYWQDPAAASALGIPLAGGEPSAEPSLFYSAVPGAQDSEAPSAPLEVRRRPYDRRVISQVRLSVATARAGIAETGTVLESTLPPGGRLLPILAPHHVVLLPEKEIYPTLGHYLQAWGAESLAPGSNLFMTGPSRTADIEKVLILGVHGPHRLWIFILS